MERVEFWYQLVKLLGTNTHYNLELKKIGFLFLFNKRLHR